MSKTVSGYEVLITAFVRADPADPAKMAAAMDTLNGIMVSDFTDLYNDDEVTISISSPRWIARRRIASSCPDSDNSLAGQSDDVTAAAGGTDGSAESQREGASYPAPITPADPSASGSLSDPTAPEQDARAGQAGGEADRTAPEVSATQPAAAEPSADPLALPAGMDRRVPKYPVGGTGGHDA